MYDQGYQSDGLRSKTSPYDPYAQQPYPQPPYDAYAQQSYEQQPHMQQPYDPYAQQPYMQPYDPYAQQAYAAPQQGYAQQPYDPYAQQPYTQGSAGTGGRPPSSSAGRRPAAKQKTEQKRRKSGSGGGKKKPANLKKKIIWLLVKVSIVVALVTWLGIEGNNWRVNKEVEPYVDRFLNNISVDGINLSGMTWEEGSAAVWAQANAKQNGWYVRLKNKEGFTKDITAEMLGISFDPSAALQQAWAIGHNSGTGGEISAFELKERVEYMNASANAAAFFSAEQSANTAPVDDILRTLENAAYVEPVDAKLAGFYPYDPMNPFAYEYERAGQRLNTAGIKEQILEMVQTFQSGEILVQPEPIPASVTVQDIEKTVALRYRAVTPIDRHSTEFRNENIRVAFSKINGIVLEDGKRFSFNSTVGRRTLDNGFKEALEYAYGELTVGVGGGVCQASTTMYLAAIQAGMTIVNRVAHSNPVGYTDLGKDATVSDTRGREIDFVFRNESGGTIYILANIITDPANKARLLCEVKIYGPSLESVRYELVHEVVQTLPKPTEPEYRKDTKGTHATYIDEQVEVSSGKDGYVVDTFLRTIADGVQTDRRKISTDRYPNGAAVVYVGTKERDY